MVLAFLARPWVTIAFKVFSTISQSSGLMRPWDHWPWPKK